jgi:hypothetical protein
MNNPAHRIPQSFSVDVAVHRLGPYQGISLGPGEHTLVVREGLVYVSLRSGDVALIPGDEVVVRHGDVRGIWNEGRDESELVVLRGG